MKTLNRSVVKVSCVLLFLLALPTILPAAVPAPTAAGPVADKVEKQTLEDVIPLTMGNIRGHKMLYDEGWLIVTSSSRALDFAKEHSIIRSRDALPEAAASAAARSRDYTTNIASDVKGAVEGGKRVMTTGTEVTRDIFKATDRVGKAELAYASESFRKAGESFIHGNL